jgi:UDPglucose--hexose-1-phosphate uridylyltransferase
VSEIRKDFLLDRWVLIAPERAQRPMPPAVGPLGDDKDGCPFCPGHEALTPPEVLALGRSRSEPDTPGWSVRVFPNKFPALRASTTVEGIGVFEAEPGLGIHEVLVESPDHGARWHRMSSSERECVLDAVRQRMIALEADSAVGSVLVFRNEGRAAGATLTHPHLQILGLPRVPPLVEAEMHAARVRYDAEGACVWCRLLEGECATGERVVEAGPDTVTLAPFAPRVPYELWILPLAHEASFTDASARVRKAMATALAEAASRLEGLLGEVAYNWFLHSARGGEAAPHYHWHAEILPRTVHAAGFEWGSGMFLHPVPPEEAASALRGVPLPPIR